MSNYIPHTAHIDCCT